VIRNIFLGASYSRGPELRLAAVMSTSLYDAAGGLAFFEQLVDRFYDRVEADPALLRVYPNPEDLGPARRHLALFLAQYWGGPQTYSEKRGHPRLRMRHSPFEIGVEARDRWLLHMRESIDSLDPPESVRSALLEYFDMAAEAMRNR
jgi:hemoglobin